jgi:hypothetical protein
MNPHLAIVKTLPPGYQKTGEFNIARDFKLLVGLNLIAFVLLVASISGLVRFSALWRPVETLQALSGSIDSITGLFAYILKLLLVIAVMVVLHEALHGLFFFIFTGERPVFAFRWSYAYAAAPGCFIPRGRYTVVGLAPLVILTISGLILIPFIPSVLLFQLILFTALNFAGAVGDLWVVGWLLRRSPAALVQDFGDRIEIYEPA